MNYKPLPLEILAEERHHLATLKEEEEGNLLPTWLNLADARRYTEQHIQKLEAWIAKHGNTWESSES